MPHIACWFLKGCLRLSILRAKSPPKNAPCEEYEATQGYLHRNLHGENTRPQVLDRSKKKLILGERKIITHQGITFNMTPSPGATSCLENALTDAKEITQYLGAHLDVERFYEELSPEELQS